MNFDKESKKIKIKKLEEIVLPKAKLKFCTDQLQNLNFLFNKRLNRDDDCSSIEKSIFIAKSITERLVQCLLCGAAEIDSRFSSKFLINNRIEQNDENSTHLEYLVRLDNLSTPLLYEDDFQINYEILENDKDCPAGYARIRLNSSTHPDHHDWSEFANSFGFLRRDRIQAKFVQLLAQAASVDNQQNSPLQVDESTMCGIPGKILDAATLNFILKIPAENQIFYGPGGNIPRFPDIRDFRLAIVDEPNGIKLNVEFLSPALATISVKVTILIAIGVDGWPSTCDFPCRIPLGHSDCLLHYQTAHTGMYLVGYGVHSSAWQIRLPAAEFTLLNHYSPNSTVRTVLDILYEILNDINSYRRFQKSISYKILNRYMLFTLLLEELEFSSTTPFEDLIYWSPMYLSTLVLKILDKVIIRLTSEFQPNYFFKKANLLVNPGHLCDDDFQTEADNIKNYLLRLFDESLMSNSGNEKFSQQLVSQETELTLLYKLKILMEKMLPPTASSKISRRLFPIGNKNNSEIREYTQYSIKQLEYISFVLQQMLQVRQKTLQPQHNFGYLNDFNENNLEDILYVLITLLDQARDEFFYTTTNANIIKNKLKIKAAYAENKSKLIELLRKDNELNNSKKKELNLNDDLILVKIILKYLYKAIDINKKYMGQILEPFLNRIFSCSYYLSHFFKDFYKNDEIEAIGIFSKLVNNAKITPAEGLMDSVDKNWIWAKEMLKMIEINTLRLVFVKERGKVYRHILSLPSYAKNDKNYENGSKTWGENNGKKQIQTLTTGRNYFTSLLNEKMPNNQNIPQYDILKINSPLTLLLKKRHRMGQHRCVGDLLTSMANLQKLDVFKDATSTLPKEDQTKLLNIVDNINSTRATKSLMKKWSNTLPTITMNKAINRQRGDENIQKYTPKEESAGIRISNEDETEKLKNNLGISRKESLLGSTRAARLRENSNVFLLQENFRIKCLLNKSEISEGI